MSPVLLEGAQYRMTLLLTRKNKCAPSLPTQNVHYQKVLITCMYFCEWLLDTIWIIICCEVIMITQKKPLRLSAQIIADVLGWLAIILVTNNYFLLVHVWPYLDARACSSKIFSWWIWKWNMELETWVINLESIFAKPVSIEKKYVTCFIFEIFLKTGLFFFKIKSGL